MSELALFTCAVCGVEGECEKKNLIMKYPMCFECYLKYRENPSILMREEQ